MRTHPTLAWLLLAGTLMSCTRGGQPAPAPAAGGASSQGGSPPASVVMPPDVLNATWQWVGLTTPVEQVAVDAPERYTIQFDKAGRLAMRADCNRGSAAYNVDADRRLTIGPLAMTRAACPQGSLSDRFAREVNRASVYFLKEGELFLDLPVDSGTLRFRRMP